MCIISNINYRTMYSYACFLQTGTPEKTADESLFVPAGHRHLPSWIYVEFSNLTLNSLSLVFHEWGRVIHCNTWKCLPRTFLRRCLYLAPVNSSSLLKSYTSLHYSDMIEIYSIHLGQQVSVHQSQYKIRLLEGTPEKYRVHKQANNIIQDYIG